MFESHGITNTLKFTAEEWKGESGFEFLDARLNWDDQGYLTCSGFKKTGQEIEYLHAESLHSPGSIKGIRKSVEKRLGRLVLDGDRETLDKKFDEIYPEHAEKILKAGLGQRSDFRSIREIQREDMDQQRCRSVKRKNRNTYFCINYSKFFSKPIHAIIEKWRKRYRLTWLRVGISYSRFSNLAEKITANLKEKLREKIGLKSVDFIERRCNCAGNNGVCNYDGVGCRKSMLVYKVHCLHPDCNTSYIGQTSQNLKKRMSGHFQDVRAKVVHGVNSDTFAAHFSKHLVDEKENLTPANQRKMMRFEVLEEVEPISAMKTFRKLSCKLCMKERLAILKSNHEGEKIMNSRSEIYGGCRHKKRFHNFLTSRDTDEPQLAKKRNLNLL